MSKKSPLILSKAYVKKLVGQRRNNDSSASYNFDSGEHKRAVKLRKWTNDLTKKINKKSDTLDDKASSKSDPDVEF